MTDTGASAPPVALRSPGSGSGLGGGIARPRSPRIRATASTVTWQRRYQRALVATDLLMVCLAAVVASVLRWQDTIPQLGALPGWAAMALLACSWLAVLFVRGAYERSALGFGLDEFRRVLNSGVHQLAALAIVSYGLNMALSRAFVFGALGLTVLFTLIGRWVLRQLVHRERKRGQAMHKVLVVGRPQAVTDLASHFLRAPQAGYEVTGVCVPSPGSERLVVLGHELPIVGRPSQVPAVMASGQFDVIAIADTTVLSDGELRALAWDLPGNDVELVVAPAIADLAGPRISVNPVAGLPLLHVDEPRFNRGSKLVKRALEMTLATAAIVLLSPVLIITALAVKFGSPGGVFYRQSRVGYNGRRFDMLKFRSMVDGAEAQLDDLVDLNETDGHLFKIKDDPRVTRVGRFIRRFSIDELPQLFQVLTGTMALVGPRPLPVDLDDFDSVEQRRFLVRPGCTGLWQVSGRSDVSWDDSVRLDLYYVDNWSIGMDLAIVFKTGIAVLRGSGAY